ncbi:MAG: CbbQ/NirQ/NorQ/GpvN family protein [Deltaproteobacteria bacterium]|nr:CbbQ/NirQ/NorQ/GpvN family protein [Deltaproteobacteria bacterium]MBW2395751.1 CbbQ/NirQ/NorQ/GpvN family protein [Deltaproteobacteria bacterium]
MVEDLYSKASALPYYRPVAGECALFEKAAEEGLPLLLKGPTGCGKSRLVEHMAARLGRPLVTVSCHDETSAADLTGRWLVRGGETQWQDGPVTRAVREGAILYMDEFAEARSDVIVVIHPLTDHRRTLYIERHDEVVKAAPGFLLVVSFNPGYQRGLKELKPSTRQRFVALAMGPPEPAVEIEILEGETGTDAATARRLVALGAKLREVEPLGLAEMPSTRLLVSAARLMLAGVAPRAACNAAIVEALTDDVEIADGLRDLVALAF